MNKLVVKLMLSFAMLSLVTASVCVATPGDQPFGPRDGTPDGHQQL